MEATLLSGPLTLCPVPWGGPKGWQVLPASDLGRGLYTFYHPWVVSAQLALAVLLGRWRIPHSFEHEEERYLSLPNSNSMKAPSLPRDGRAWLQVTQEGKASPGNSLSEALNLPPPRRWVSRLSSSKPPPTPPATSAWGCRKRKTWGWGHQACQLTSCTFWAFY